MKHTQSLFIGNVLMGAGMVAMVGGIVTAVMNQLPSMHLSQLAVGGAIFAIFLGALLWLTGAQVGGKEKVCDRYFLLRYDGCRLHSRHK